MLNSKHSFPNLSFCYQENSRNETKRKVFPFSLSVVKIKIQGELKKYYYYFECLLNFMSQSEPQFERKRRPWNV